MKYIYKMENKINGKKYIGQTNNFRLRMNGHKSDAFNKNSTAYNYPLSCAIRKYGWDNFNNAIIEEIPDDESFEIVDEREKYFIQYYDSLSNKSGYNITIGGQGCPRQKLSYEERIKKSKLFTADEIKDIQQLLKQQIEKSKIRTKYYPRLTLSYLENINAGLNFKNDDWEYPLCDYTKLIKKSDRFSEQEIVLIKEDIKSNLTYQQIAEKWNITIGFISSINNGKSWFDKKEHYPLCVKGHSSIHNQEWVKMVQNDLMNSNLPLIEISKKYNKSYSTIKKINSGSSHKLTECIYPLTKNRKN